jgi:hypothetical protein
MLLCIRYIGSMGRGLVSTLGGADLSVVHIASKGVVVAFMKVFATKRDHACS